MSFIHEFDAGWVQHKPIPSKEDRNAFYQSRTWHAIRENARRRDFYMCRICERNRAVDGHHLTYARWGGEEEPRDILSLCRDCHGKIHEKKEDPNDEAKNREAIEADFNEHLYEMDLSGCLCGCLRCFHFWREHKRINLGAFGV